MFEKKTNFVINLIELKYRTIYAGLTLLLTFLVCFYYKVELFFLISNFFLEFEEGFIYTSLLDPIVIYLKLAFLFSLIFSVPIIIYIYGFFFIKSFYSFYLYFFIFYVFIIYISSFSLFIFLSSLILPILLDFLISFQEVNSYSLVLQATITQYYSFFFSYLYLFILLILVPNLYLLLIFFGFVSSENFFSNKFRKYLYLIVILIFLLFAPPDFLIQITILPLLFIILEVYIYIITFLYTLYLAF